MFIMAFRVRRFILRKGIKCILDTLLQTDIDNPKRTVLPLSDKSRLISLTQQTINDTREIFSGCVGDDTENPRKLPK